MDNVVFQTTAATPPTGTVVSTEEITNLNGAVVSAQHAQRVILSLRTADNTALDITTANPLPISDAGGSLTVDGPLTDTQLRASAVNVSVTAFPNEGQQSMANSVSVVIASDQPAISVLGPLTDTQLRATPVPVSGTLSVSGNVEITNDVGNPLPVSAVSLPLPTGAATLAEQQAQTTSLQLIDDAVYTDGTGTPSKAVGIAGTDGTNPQIIKTDAAGELQVDVLTLPSVTIGAALPAGINNIGDVDVLTLPAIPTGDNSIGRVKITDGTDVADVLDLTNSNPLVTAIVDATGNQITSFGGGTQYDEDTVSAAADKLTMAGVVRKDSAASLVDTDGDRTQLQVDAAGALRVTGGGGGTEYTEDTAAPADPVGNQLMARRRDSLATETTTDGDVTALNATAKGELHVKHADPITVAGVATASNQSTQTTILGQIRDSISADDSAFTMASSSVQAIGAVLDNTSPASVTENNLGVLRMSANRNLFTQIRDAAGNERGVEVTAANALKVDNSAVTQPVSAASLPLPTGAATLAEQQTQTTALQLIDDTVYTDGTGTPSKAIGIAGTDGTNPQIVKTDANGELQVDVLTLPALSAGSNNIGDVDVLTLPNVTLAAGTNTNEIVGDVAEDAALAGNPVRMGMRASTAIPAAMSTDGDVVTPWANRNGAQVVTQAPHVGLNSDPFNLLHEAVRLTASSTGTDIVSPTAGKKLVVTKCMIGVGGTTGGEVQVYFGDGTYSRGTNRAIFDHEFAPSATLKPGVVLDGPFIAGAADDNLRVASSANINPLTVSVWYYEI